VRFLFFYVACLLSCTKQKYLFFAKKASTHKNTTFIEILLPFVVSLPKKRASLAFYANYVPSSA
jgi:hypothetical protein